MGWVDHLLYECMDDNRKVGAVSTRIEITNWGRTRNCYLSWIKSNPERQGLGSATLPLVIEYLASLNCDNIHGTILETSKGFWDKFADVDDQGQLSRGKTA